MRFAKGLWVHQLAEGLPVTPTLLQAVLGRASSAATAAHSSSVFSTDVLHTTAALVV